MNREQLWHKMQNEGQKLQHSIDTRNRYRGAAEMQAVIMMHLNSMENPTKREVYKMVAAIDPKDIIKDMK